MGEVVKTKRKIAKNGSRQSSIVALGLEDIVQELRSKKGWGAMKIAKYINGNAKKYLPDDGSQVTVPSLNRYLKDRGLNDTRKEDAKEAINVYRVECDALEKIQFIAEALFNRIEACTEIDQDDERYDSKLLIELSKSYREITTKQSSLVASICRMQEKVYSFSIVSQIVQRTFDILKERDNELANEIRAEIKKDPILNECYRKMKTEE